MSSLPASTDYAALKRTITQSGLLKPTNGYYAIKTVTGLLILGAAVAVTLTVTHWALVLAAAAFLGFATTQTALLAHDVGHRQGYRGRRTNTIARTVFGNVLLGVSHSWWVEKHNQHHAAPNHVDEDPDLELPFFVMTREQLADRPRLLRPLLAIQGILLPFLFPLQGIAMRVTSVGHLLTGSSRHPWREAAFMGLHFALYGLLLWSIGNVWLAIAFAAVHQGVFGIYNSSVFASNHKGMQMIRPGEGLDFLREQVLTSRNVKAHRFADFWYGGLNYQIEHHLFPTMPRKNLSKAQPIVRQFCVDHGIPYYETGAFRCYLEVFRHFQWAGSSRPVKGAV